MRRIALTVIVLMGLAATGCKKDAGGERNPVGEYKTPFKSYLDERNVLPIQMEVTSPATFEIGYLFSLIRTQRVMALGLLMPQNGEYSVSLWDADAERLIVTAKVTVTSNEFHYTNIAAVTLEPRKNYVLSMNTTVESEGSSHYVYQLAAPPFPLYPLQIGPMTIQALVQRSTDTPLFPYLSLEERQFNIEGVPDMSFE